MHTHVNSGSFAQVRSAGMSVYATPVRFLGSLHHSVLGGLYYPTMTNIQQYLKFVVNQDEMLFLTFFKRSNILLFIKKPYRLVT